MPGIWSNTGSEWSLLSPEGFPNEARLHRLVEEAPQMLPLAGAPQLTILGREVQLGSGYADLLAVESSGRLALIEVKLAQNAEARRAIVSQVLSYAAYLHGMDLAELEQGVLGRHLRDRAIGSLLEAAQRSDQAVEPETFSAAAAEYLREGHFRLVLVLDAAPRDLVRLVGYLQAVTDKLLIDLITVSSYRVGDSEVILPERVDPEPTRMSAATRSTATQPREGRLSEGAGEFEAAISDSPAASQRDLRRYCEWAKGLEADGLVRLQSMRGVGRGRFILLPRFPTEGVGLVSIWTDNGSPYLQLWRSVFERHVPHLIPRIEALLDPTLLRQGNAARTVSDELLRALTDAYRAATPSTARTAESSPSASNGLSR